MLSAFQTTLNEPANSDLVLLFVDGGDDLETVIRKITTSHKIMNKEIHGVPVLTCINKADLATRDNALAETRKISVAEEILEMSTKTGVNVLCLLRKSPETLTAAAPRRCSWTTSLPSLDTETISSSYPEVQAPAYRDPTWGKVACHTS
jgi:50S ribosomal subunit-associated GTPase HflX